MFLVKMGSPTATTTTAQFESFLFYFFINATTTIIISLWWCLTLNRLFFVCIFVAYFQHTNTIHRLLCFCVSMRHLKISRFWCGIHCVLRACTVDSSCQFCKFLLSKTSICFQFSSSSAHTKQNKNNQRKIWQHLLLLLTKATGNCFRQI